MRHVQALESLGKLEQVAGNVRMALNNISAGNRADLIRTEKDRNICTFIELVKGLRQWVERKPGDKRLKFKPSDTRDHIKQPHCVYCETI